MPAGEEALGDGHRAGDGAADEEALRERLAAVAPLVEVLADHAVSNALVVGGEVHLLALQRGDDLLGRVHPGVHRVVDALELGDVHHRRRVAGDHHAGNRELPWHRPVAARGDRLRAPRLALAALEQVLHERVRLELLEGVVDGEGRVRVVEAADHADAELVLAHRVDEAAAELVPLGALAKRPAHRVDHAVERLLHLPDLLDAQLPALRQVAVEVEVVERGPGEVARRCPRRAPSPSRSGRTPARSCPAPCPPGRGPCPRSGRRPRRDPRPAASSPRSRSAGRRPASSAFSPRKRLSFAIEVT